ncbi:hypothetical protein BDP67DRAFT_524751 [Colletotrichum lupini]|nr:hypothetical protein BDP67DRAFT_524751 [Colletotrichum lupini]
MQVINLKLNDRTAVSLSPLMICWLFLFARSEGQPPVGTPRPPPCNAGCNARHQPMSKTHEMLLARVSECSTSAARSTTRSTLCTASRTDCFGVTVVH